MSNQKVRNLRPDPPNLTTPPHSEEAEQALIGAILLFPELSVYLESLAVEDFHGEKNAIVAESLLELHRERAHIDLITTTARLRLRGKLDEIGGIAYLGECADCIPTAAHIEHYAKVIKEMSLRRQLADLLEQSKQGALGALGLSETMGRLHRELRALEGEEDKSAVPAKNVIADVMKALERIYQTGEEPVRLKTGLAALDEKLWIGDEDLIIVAGRPSMGKTSLVLSIANAIAANTDGKKVLFFSLEMSKESLGMRLLSHRSGVPISRIRDPRTMRPDTDLPRLLAVADSALENLHIDDRKGLTVSAIRSACRAIPNLGAVCIDYVGLIESEDKKAMREQQVSDISKALKHLAADLKAPIFLLSQLNRSLEKRPDKRPLPSDLRESGSIEQDADTILFVYRDEVYNPETEDRGIAEIIIGKQRNGETGHVRAKWRAETTSFLDLVE